MNIDTTSMTTAEVKLFEAVNKMSAGLRLFEEGQAEMRSLMGKSTKVAAKTEEEPIPCAPSEKVRKIVAHRTATRGRRKMRLDKGTLDKVFNAIKSDRWAIPASIAEKTEISAYTVNRAIEQLKKSRRIEADFRKGNPNHSDPRTKGRVYRYWQAI